VIDNNKSFSMAVCLSAADQNDKALGLSRKLSIPLVSHETDEYEFLLLYSANGLALKHTGEKGVEPIMVSFTSPTMTYRIKHGGGRSQALARAVGLKKGWQPTVIDATAGFGRDGFILACLGCHVHMLERSPILAALLEDALQRAIESGQVSEIIKKRLRFTETDSIDFLQKLQQEDYPDVIYLDPMYPVRTKSSLVKKEMRILRGLAGNDKDANDLLTIALACARKRVVVKRPRLAATLSGWAPSHQITGKTSRFDVYLI
jgi:16S rRNA (guanine1516-N2)-methyltransferase